MSFRQIHILQDLQSQELVNNGQQMLTKVSLVKNMISQLSKTVSDVILSFSEHVLIFRKIKSFLLVFWKYEISLQF